MACSAFVGLFVIVTACAKKQDDSSQPSATPTAASGYPQQYGQPYGQQYPQQYPQQQPYGQPQPYAQPQPTYAQPQPAPTGAPPGAASGQMSVPGPLAFQCQNDMPCGLHHCNTQYGKCAFPCQSAADCISPNQCVAGLCVPAPAQH
jgi:hypothetical protein